MTTSTKAWVARERWRADLLDYSAGLLDTIDMTGDADKKRHDAEARRNLADAAEHYATAAKKDPKSKEAKQAARQLRSARAAYRSSGTTVDIVDNFSEPTDAELEGGKS
jgi:hypothetical protein